MSGLRFIFLDSAHWITKDGIETDYFGLEIDKEGGYIGIGPTEEELDWLKHELAKNQNIPTIIITHAPIHSKTHLSLKYPAKGITG